MDAWTDDELDTLIDLAGSLRPWMCQGYGDGFGGCDYRTHDLQAAQAHSMMTRHVRRREPSDEDRQREAFIAGWKSGWYVRDNAIDDDTAEQAYERWKDVRDG